MKRKHFEASVCRESTQHDWRWFITWQEGGEWVSYLYDATPEGLDEAVRMNDRKGWRSKMIDAYLYACTKNDVIHRADWNEAFPLMDKTA
jgi:hypothetical protein